MILHHRDKETQRLNRGKTKRKRRKERRGIRRRCSSNLLFSIYFLCEASVSLCLCGKSLTRFFLLYPRLFLLEMKGAVHQEVMRVEGNGL